MVFNEYRHPLATDHFRHTEKCQYGVRLFFLANFAGEHLIFMLYHFGELGQPSKGCRRSRSGSSAGRTQATRAQVVNGKIEKEKVSKRSSRRLSRAGPPSSSMVSGDEAGSDSHGYLLHAGRRHSRRSRLRRRVLAAPSARGRLRAARPSDIHTHTAHGACLTTCGTSTRCAFVRPSGHVGSCIARRP
eukprot:7379452-Prymnesium_polylepis.1